MLLIFFALLASLSASLAYLSLELLGFIRHEIYFESLGPFLKNFFDYQRRNVGIVFLSVFIISFRLIGVFWPDVRTFPWVASLIFWMGFFICVVQAFNEECRIRCLAELEQGIVVRVILPKDEPELHFVLQRKIGEVKELLEEEGIRGALVFCYGKKRKWKTLLIG